MNLNDFSNYSSSQSEQFLFTAAITNQITKYSIENIIRYNILSIQRSLTFETKPLSRHTL